MQTYLDCIPCFFRQSLEAVRRVSEDPEAHAALLRHVAKEVSEMDLSTPPPLMGVRFHRSIRERWGGDPYAEMKRRANRLALAHLERMRERIAQAAEPLLAAAKVAIVGNMIDAGVHGDFCEEEVVAALETALEEPLLGDIEAFHKALEAASSILFFADNAGEIVFDRLLLEQLPLEKVRLVVRGAPILNDATLADAQEAGLPELVEVLENGSDIPGTVIAACNTAVQAAYQEADLIIAKGQGNYETLSEIDKPAFFLLKAKCPVIANDLKCQCGRLVLRENKHVQRLLERGDSNDESRKLEIGAL